MITAVRGTKDILDDDSVRYDYIVEKASEVLKKFQYKRIITPIFEETHLFKRGIGEGTDIVEKEMYTFEDKGGRNITLRPEGTAAVVRAYIEHKVYGKENFTKYFYHGPMFRYERPQAGRYREFNQIGVEAIGSNSPALDAELIYMAEQLLTKLEIKNIELQINSVGCPECRKVYREKLKEFLLDKLPELCDDCKVRYEKNPLRILDCKVERCKQKTAEAPEMLSYLCESCNNHFNKVKVFLSVFNVKYIINKRLVRGLDYYTNTAFEFVSNNLGSQGTILAGGRYNNLIEEIGGKSIPAVGFAAGVERLSMLIPERKTDLSLVYLVVIGEDNLEYSIGVLKSLRENNINADMDFESRSVKTQMKNAAKMNAGYALIIGENEVKEESVVIKNMETGEQTVCKKEEIIKKLKEEK